jgi:hypothetical protein
MHFFVKHKKEFAQILEIRGKLFYLSSQQTYKVLKTLQEEKNLSTLAPQNLSSFKKK